MRREGTERSLSGLLFLAGLVVPLLACVMAFGSGRPARLATLFIALALTDGPLVALGARGHGAPGVIQPWRWLPYLAWLGIRLAILLPLALVQPAGP